MATTYEAGTVLEVRGEQWRLTRAAPLGACTILTLEGRDRANAHRRLRIIEPFDRPRPIAIDALSRRSRQAVLRTALAAIAGAKPAGGLWTAAAVQIDLLAYQLEPALAALTGATRLLLADGVGLGKTIQAGLVLAELRERGWVERALVLCPAGLRATWATELRTRFGIEAAIVDQASIAASVASLPPGVNPWSGHAIAIASIDLVKRPEVLAAVAAEPIDLLIADEAHHLTPGTDRGAAVERLASQAPWCVLVSATPHSGDQAAFDYLTHLGAHDDPIAIFRRSRRDVGLPAARRLHVLEITPTRDEAALHSAIDDYARAVWQAREQPAVRLIAVTLARRAASSPLAIERTLVRRLALLGAAPIEPTQPRLPWDDEDDADGMEPDSLLAMPAFDNIAGERAAIARLIDLVRSCGAGSKLRRAARLIDRVREPLVIFTEYRDTLDALVSATATTRRVAAIHGGLASSLRREVVDAFNQGRADVLIATDAAGEGLNLHHRCRLVIDMELPWNPLRLEQRIGRVDRLGQRRRVHAIRLVHPNTIEERVLAHLKLRQQRAGWAMDDVFVGDSDMASAVFDGIPIAQTPRPVVAGNVAASLSRVATAEVSRLEYQRRILRLAAPDIPGTAWTPPRRQSTSRVHLLHRVTLVNGFGSRIDEYLAALVISLRPLPRNRREWRIAVDRLRRDSRLRTLINQQLTERRAALGIDLDRDRSRLLARIAAIRARLRLDAAVTHQGSLFDRSVEAAAASRRDTVARLDAALAIRAECVSSPVGAAGSRITLVAAWPFDSAREIARLAQDRLFDSAREIARLAQDGPVDSARGIARLAQDRPRRQ